MAENPTPPGISLAEELNQDCHCISVNKDALRSSLQAHLSDQGLSEQLLSKHSHLFSSSPVFLWQQHIDKMQALINAVEKVVGNNKKYREAVLSAAPAIARQDPGPKGVFFGYDFHLAENGPQLIEINTNAGGVLLNLYLAAAQRACCEDVEAFFGVSTSFEALENQLIAMFKAEYRLHNSGKISGKASGKISGKASGKELRSIAIVDHDPQSQFLYPEFLLFKSLFERHGIRATIADPKELWIKNGQLFAGNQETASQKIDLVYNRLTDFYLEHPDSLCLKRAYQEKIAVLTPSPHGYSLYADKRNLVLLSDTDRLNALGVNPATIKTLVKSLPAAVRVTRDNADELWQRRRQLFFKPVAGYGSRGTYKGAKITRKVWGNILQSDYIAQTMIPPSERHLVIDDEHCVLKVDIRCVVYNGRIQQLSSRLYQGQTTNLRTRGGGLATVFPAP